MKKIIPAVLLPVALLVSAIANSQTAVLLKDINTSTVGVPSSPGKGIWMGSNYYFAATDGITGIELWKGDGTSGNTTLVKDIYAGNGSSTPTNFLVIGTTLYFTADDGVHGSELWKTDGTAGGTVLIKDINPGIQNATIGRMAALGSTLIFDADDGVNGDELWKSDGTTAGTVMVKDIIAGPHGSIINRMASTGTKVYFCATATDGQGDYELYKTDGTASGTVLVKAINPSTYIGGVSGTFFTWGETLYFIGDDGSNGGELWKSDGTAGGTVMVKDIYTGSVSGLPNSSYPTNFTVMGSKMYFSAADGNGTELWVTDGTGANTVMVKDINSGASSSSPSRLTAVGSTLYFRATNGSTNGSELWKSDGTSSGTLLVKDIYSGSPSSSPDQLTAIGSNLYFAANDGTNGVELWKTDGTSANTVLLKDINTGAGLGSAITNAVGNGTTIMFSADNGTNGAELWKTTGTTANTSLVKNINPDNGNSNIASLTPLGSKIVFSADNGTDGVEPWVTDGTVAGTQMLANINPTAGTGSTTQRFAAAGGLVYFSANNGTQGNEVWKTDGTTAGTSLLKDINSGSGSATPKNFYPFGGSVYFAANDGTNGNELWKTDGTAANTVLVKDIVSGSSGSSPGGSGIPNIISNGSMLLFAGLNQNAGQETGWELYGSTGAVGNGGLIKDINTSSFAASSSPSNFVYPGSGSYVYFEADNGVNGIELWKSDGTAANTTMVKDITSGAESTNFSQFVTLGGKIYFSAYSSTAGVELWQSDGTSAGTIVLKDINSGIGSSDPQGLTVCGSYIYFSADDGTNGRELWRTDGTAGGTTMVANIVSGSGSSNPANLFWHPTLQSVFFSAYTPANGVELWEYDGSTAHLYTEVVAGAGSSNPGPIMLAGNNLVFVATNGTSGLELYGVETYNTWAGGTSSTWSTSGNWKKNLVPGTTESAILPSTGVTNEATLDVNATVTRLEIESGRSLTISSGKTLTVSDLIFNSGTIKGAGTLVNSNFANPGTIAPGTSPGILTLTGNLVQTGNLDIELGGLTVGTQYDRLVVSGSVNLSGTLNLSVINSFHLQNSQNFTIITCGSRTGTFTTVNWPAGVTGTITYNATSVVVNITSVLPLTLLDFHARLNVDKVGLTWSTADEVNTSHFDIERSADGYTFTTIGTVAARGSGGSNYQMTDNLPQDGVNYYRLKMIDNNGRFTYSPVVLVRLNGKGIAVMPVPASSFVTISVKENNLLGTKALIYNAAGAVVSEISLDRTVTLDVSSWASGIYTLRAGTSTSIRFTKQ